MIKSWKTTVAGLITGLPLVLEGVLNAVAQGAFIGQGKYQIMAGIGVIIFGIYAKDKDVTGNPPKAIQ